MAMDCVYRLRIPHKAGQLAAVASRIADLGGLIGDVTTISVARDEAIREMTIETRDNACMDRVARYQDETGKHLEDPQFCSEREDHNGR